MTLCTENGMVPAIIEEDILEAMKAMEGYVDITPGDFAALYGLAYRHAFMRLARSIAVGEVMTRRILSVQKDTSLVALVKDMAKRGVSGVPVVDEGKRVVGIISEKDVLRHICIGGAGSFMDIAARCLSGDECIRPERGLLKAVEVMTHPAVTVTEDALVSQAAAIFTTHHINRLPVTGKDGVLTGMITRGDIIRASCAATGLSDVPEIK